MIVPLRSRVVAEPIKDEPDLHVGRIALSSVDDVKRARVLATGDGHVSPTGTLVPLSVKPGDVVLYKKGSGQLCNSYRKQYLILQEVEILGKETPEPSAS